MTDKPALQKPREFQNHHFDSTVWNDFDFRHDEIVVATHARFGTTWTQQTIWQLPFGAAPDPDTAELPPWPELREPAIEDNLPVVEAHRQYFDEWLESGSPR